VQIGDWCGFGQLNMPSAQDNPAGLPAVPTRPSLPFLGSLPSLSSGYIIQPVVSCLVLFIQWAPIAFCLALARAGKSIPARIAIIAITTRSSISVNPVGRGRCEDRTDESLNSFMFANCTRERSGRSKPRHSPHHAGRTGRHNGSQRSYAHIVAAIVSCSWPGLSTKILKHYEFVKHILHILAAYL